MIDENDSKSDEASIESQIKHLESQLSGLKRGRVKDEVRKERAEAKKDSMTILEASIKIEALLKIIIHQHKQQEHNNKALTTVSKRHRECCSHLADIILDTWDYDTILGSETE